MIEDIRPWERQANESAEYHHAFTHYLEIPLGQRSLDRGWQEHRTNCRHLPLSKKPRNTRAKDWEKASVQWGWVQRVEAWDKEVFRLAHEKMLKDPGHFSRPSDVERNPAV
jgi:hypothetical protein